MKLNCLRKDDSGVFIKWFSHIGTLLSLIGIIFAYSKDNKLWMGILIAFALIAFIVTIVSEYRLHKKAIHSFKNDQEINQYMIKIIKEEGRAIIFTNDMSWAENNQYVKKILEEKSKKKELNIILYDRSLMTDSLEKLGANIFTYGETGYIPTTRFTIVKAGRIDSKVAIGKKVRGKHLVEEFSAEDGYPLHIAKDMSNLIMKYNAKTGK